MFYFTAAILGIYDGGNLAKTSQYILKVVLYAQDDEITNVFRLILVLIIIIVMTEINVLSSIIKTVRYFFDNCFSLHFMPNIKLLFVLLFSNVDIAKYLSVYYFDDVNFLKC